jgi:hypothetical protein
MLQDIALLPGCKFINRIANTAQPSRCAVHFNGRNNGALTAATCSGSAQLVQDENCQRLSSNILCDDEQRFATLCDLLALGTELLS